MISEATFLISLTVVLVLSALALVSLRSMARSREERERELTRLHLQLIRSLENRLSAKDLSGYLALEDRDLAEKRGLGPHYVSRSDEFEAKLERQHNG